MVDQTEGKRLAGISAAQMVQPGMVVGLGFGSTAIHALRHIGERLRSGDLQDVLGVPTADSVARNAMEVGIPLTTLEAHPFIDLTIDGADEVDPELNLIKGGGGALLREKIVAQASERLLIVVDPSKLSAQLGTHFRLPVEVLPFGWGSQARYLESLSAEVELRKDKNGVTFISDNGNYILDCDFGKIDDAKSLAAQLENRAGIVEHGLFIGLADEVFVGRSEGVESLRRVAR